MIYDCYAVSNHIGGMGGGHYTSYARDTTSGQWYSFNDSSCLPATKVVEQDIASKWAYNLFFRRRDWHAGNTKDSCDFEKIALKPDFKILGLEGRPVPPAAPVKPAAAKEEEKPKESEPVK